METRAPAVVAVVVTTGPGPGLDATLASLVAQDFEQLSILVVANGDTTDVGERVAAVAPHAFIKFLDENRGFAAACNEGALMVDGAAFFLFCHDDVRLEPDAVQRMVEAAYRTNGGIITPKVVDYDDPLVLLHVGQNCDRFGVVRERIQPGEIDHGQQDLERDVFVAPGGVTLIRRDLFVTLRGFDPLIPALGEDLDLCWRAQVAGARVVVAPLAKVAHRESVARGERPVQALGTRRARTRDLQRRHQLLTVATGWGLWTTLWTLSALAVLDAVEFGISLVGRDVSRGRSILSSWRWLLANARRVRVRRRALHDLRVLTDRQLHRLQIGGAARLRSFLLTLFREGYDRATGSLPAGDHFVESVAPVSEGVGFAAAFTSDDEFDELTDQAIYETRFRISRVLTSFRGQILTIAFMVVLWLIGTRNLVATHLPLIGRLAPLDSWWSTWRHYFASWSPNGVGTGAPGLPGYGFVAFAGTFVLGRMGILPRLILIFAVPVGAVGIARLLKNKVSNRARVVSTVAYVVMPVGLNMISQGRLDILVLGAGLPFLLRRLFELLDVPGFRQRPYSEPVAFGTKGWRTSENGQRAVTAMFIAMLVAFVPSTLILVAVIVLGVYVARRFVPDPSIEGHRSFPASRHWRLLGSLTLTALIFVLPLTADTLLAGRQFLEVFGLPRGPWSAPHFSSLLRGADGIFGGGWLGWVLPVGALLSGLLARGQRQNWASKLLTINALCLVMAVAVARNWLGAFAPDLDAILALYVVGIALLLGVGVAAIENDVRDVNFGWRQVVAGATVLTLIVGSLGVFVNVGSGRFDMPTTSIAESLGSLAPTDAGGYRVLWLGDPSVLPVTGWSIRPGLEFATTMNGLPAGASLFSPPDEGTAGVLADDLSRAFNNQTVNLGTFLARDGISTVVVMNSAAPELSGVQSVPLAPVPKIVDISLARQNDLTLELQTASVSVYGNTKFHGVTSLVSNGSKPVPVFSSTSNAATIPTPATVTAALAPAGAFALDVNGHATARRVVGGWIPQYTVNAAGQNVQATFTLHQFPLNGLLALFTLGLWLITLLGFGWLDRLTWLADWRPRRRTRARHARGAK